MLLALFAGVTIRDPETGVLPAFVFAAVVGGGFYTIQELQRRAWSKRYLKALHELRSITPSSGHDDDIPS